jgi:hypothetical protein
MGWFIITVSIPASEAKPSGCYRKNGKTFNIEHSTPNVEGRHAPLHWMFEVECWALNFSPKITAA